MKRDRSSTPACLAARWLTLALPLFFASACEQKNVHVDTPPSKMGDAPLLLDHNPIDLVIFHADEAALQVKINSERTTDTRISTIFTAGASAGDHPAYWTAPAPVTLDIALGRTCYVSSVVVYPVSEMYGVGGYEVETAFDAESRRTVPAGRYVHRSSSSAAPYDRPAAAAVVNFFPKYTNTVRIRFSGSMGDPEKVFLRNIRILGKPAEDVNEQRAQSPIGETALLAAQDPVNLATFTKDDISGRILVSEDRNPNGSVEALWQEGDDAAQLAADQPRYWCATSPAWITIDLGTECLLSEVLLDALNEARGFETAYVKFIDDNGRERDPAFADGATETLNTSTGNTLRFAPDRTRRLKLYINAAPGSRFVYLRTIKILGNVHENLQDRTPS